MFRLRPLPSLFKTFSIRRAMHSRTLPEINYYTFRSHIVASLKKSNFDLLTPIINVLGEESCPPYLKHLLNNDYLDLKKMPDEDLDIIISSFSDPEWQTLLDSLPIKLVTTLPDSELKMLLEIFPHSWKAKLLFAVDNTGEFALSKEHLLDKQTMDYIQTLLANKSEEEKSVANGSRIK